MIINFYEHPFQAAPPEVIEHHSIAEWLLDRFGVVPTVTLQVFVGAPSQQTEITHDIDALIYGSAKEYTVLQSPGGGVGKAIGAVFGGPIAWATGLLYSAASLLNPKVPSYGGIALQNQSRSSNNELGERSNKVRILQRIEDIYGTVRSIPTLLMPSYTKYINHTQYEYSYLCVGRGYYSISDVRDSETLLSDITGARAAIYDPFASPNSGTAVATIGDAIEDTVLTVKRSNEVDGITLKALNQLQLPALDTYDYLPASALSTTGDVIRQTVKKPNMNTVLSAGDFITVDTGDMPKAITASVSFSATDDSINGSAVFGPLNLEPGDTITVSGSVSNDGSYFVSTATTSKIIVSAALTTESAVLATITNQDANDYSGVYEIAEVADGYVVLTTTAWADQYNDFSSNVTINDVTEYTNWVTLPTTDRAQVWLNLLAINGIYKDSGGGKALTDVEIEIQIEQLTSALVATGIVETVTETLSGATSDLRASTVEQLTAFTGPCRVRARRTTDYDYDFAGQVQDEIKLADLYSVSPVTAANFGNVTTIYTVTKATLRALAAKDRQLNCLASRLLPTYDGTAFSGAVDSTGLHVSGTISATSRWIDILPAVSIDPWIGNRSIAELDMRQLWATHLAIEEWGSDYGQFNYTFDSDNLSYEDTVSMIADAVFCKPYRQNGLIRFSWQRAQTSPNMPTFCHRNKRPDSETITRSFASDAEYDGVELVYQDPDTERAETIRLPLDGNYTKLKKIDVPGIRNFAQAWVRANREYNRLLNQRQALDFEATADARLLLPGTRIDVVDDTRFKRYGGEVIGQDGLELLLSQPVGFTYGTHSIILKRRDGSSQSITCTAGSTSNRVVLSGLPSEPVVTAYSQDGIRTIYSFAADSLRDKQSWIVEQISPGESDYVRISAVNYTSDYWTGDAAAIPDKSTIIY